MDTRASANSLIRNDCSGDNARDRHAGNHSRVQRKHASRIAGAEAADAALVCMYSRHTYRSASTVPTDTSEHPRWQNFQPQSLHQPHHQSRGAFRSQRASQPSTTCSASYLQHAEILQREVLARRPVHRKKCTCKPRPRHPDQLAAFRRGGRSGGSELMLRGFYSMQKTHLRLEWARRNAVWSGCDAAVDGWELKDGDLWGGRNRFPSNMAVRGGEEMIMILRARQHNTT